tara:strand:- start:474 stop:734 length:261 start_codon:yes stop_codon:yes gene_type:complete
MLEEISSCLKNLENSYMLSFREVSKETIKLNNLLNEFKNYDTKDEPNKQKILNIAGTIEDLSIKNEYKLNLIKEFPEYFSNIRSKK